MEQRVYHGNVTPDGLADYLVQYYNSREDLRAQKLGSGDSLVVQIGHAHHDDQELRHAITLGIHRDAGDAQALIVTMGEQQWITPGLATYAAMMGLISILVTPWALFALIWPLSAMLGSRVLPGDIWHTVQTYVMSQGAVPGMAQTVEHPHVGASPTATQAFSQPVPAEPQAFTQPPPCTSPSTVEDAKTQRLNDPRTS